MSVIAFVPARRGSVGIKGKNTAIVNGKPMVAHVLTTLKSMTNLDRIVVSTDDPNVAAIAVLYGVEVINRPDVLANGSATIDEVVQWFRVENGFNHSYLVVQPTVPEVTSEMLNALMGHDTGVAWALATPAPHLFYHEGKPLWRTRANRQDLTDSVTQEVGVRWYPPDSEGVTGVHPVPGLLDVDTLGDLVELRNRFDDWSVVFRCKVGPDIGHGHLARCLAIAEQLQHHAIYLDVLSDDGTRLQVPWPEVTLVRVMQEPDERVLIVNDTLDTSVEEMLDLKSFGPVVTLEDRGPGAAHADAVINALYADGPGYAVLRPEFIGAPPVQRGDHILVTFGGTDPAHLTERFAALGLDPVEIVAPPGRTMDGVPGFWPTSMAYELARAQLVVTSCGRTLYEAAAMGTPAVAIAANVRETTHGHLGVEYGNVYLGHHALVTDVDILEAVNAVSTDSQLWGQLRAAALRQVDGKGVFRVARRIEDVMLEWE